MQQEIRAFLEERFMFRFGDEINEDTDLFKVGVLDSLGYVSLMGYLESRYGTQFSEDQLLGGVRVSLAGIVRLVQEARAQAERN